MAIESELQEGDPWIESPAASSLEAEAVAVLRVVVRQLLLAGRVALPAGAALELSHAVVVGRPSLDAHAPPGVEEEEVT